MSYHDTPPPSWYEPPDPDAPTPCVGGKCRMIDGELHECEGHLQEARERRARWEQIDVDEYDLDQAA